MTLRVQDKVKVVKSPIDGYNFIYNLQQVKVCCFLVANLKVSPKHSRMLNYLTSIRCLFVKKALVSCEQATNKHLSVTLNENVIKVDAVIGANGNVIRAFKLS